MTTKKLTKLLALYLPYILLGLVATNLGEAWRLSDGKELGDKIMSMMGTIPVAFANPLPSLHPLDFLVGVCCGAGLRLAVYLRGKNAKKYRHGMEYGSARWGTPKDIEPFMAPKFSDNIILTKTERLMMSNRPPDPKNARNKNVLVVGGSGSGKTRFWLKPNLLQMHSSYVVTDPKSTILLECGNAMLKNGYKVRIPMMKIKKFGALLVSAVLCIGMAAPAFAYEGDTTTVEEPVLPEIVEEEDAVTITDEETGALTPEGNLTLVDDYYTNYSDGSGQQFITMVSKSGATFYLVIDRNAKGQQTVHFMNLVDEGDLLTLMEEEDAEAYNAEKEAAKQAELDKLKAEEEAKKAAEEAEKAADAPKENKVTKYAAAFLGVVALIALVAGGGFYFFIQQKQKKQAEKEAVDPDADYTEDNGDFEIPPEDDSDDEDTSEEQDITPI